MNRIICIVFSLALTLVFVAESADAAPRARAQSNNSVNSSRGGGAQNNAGNRANNNQANRNRDVNSNNNVNNSGNRNTNVNRNNNVNIDNDINVDIDDDHRGGYGGCCYDNDYHPVAAAAAITATAAIIGSMVYSLPPSCSTVMVDGFAYQQCGGTWYQPQMSGSSTSYEVVNAPPGY